MSRYIEFTTSTENPYVYNARGNPVHDGTLPTQFREVAGVRVDGEPLAFTDSSLVESLHRALVESKALQKRGHIVDCVTFVALLQCIPLAHPDDNPFIDHIQENIQVHPKDRITDPVCLGDYPFKRLMQHPRYLHVVSPAHIPERPNYVHKLGDNEPVCLSGLADAMTIFGCTVAHPVKR
jgi:hypothetical protein